MGALTNETVFELTECPRRMAVIGAGPIGCELAQAFARFGSEVSLVEMEPRILPREDADAAAVVQTRLTDDGVRFAGGARISEVTRRGDERVVAYTDDAGAHELVVDEVLVGVGRAPNVEGLGLDAAGVACGRAGVEVDATLRTSNPRVFAAGDVCSRFKFTHAADAMAQIVIQNALFPHPLGLGRARTDRLIIPWCTYTDPEIAHVGLSEAEATARGIATETFTQPLAEVDRAVLDGEDTGFVRVHVKRGTDTIVGATAVAAHAGDLICEITLAMRAGLGLGTVGATVHPYPTQADAWRKVATKLRKARFTERQRSILARWFAWAR